MNILNRIAQQVPLVDGSLNVKKRRGRKPKVISDEEGIKQTKKKKIGAGSRGKKRPAEQIEGKIESEPRKRGRPKSKDTTSKAKKMKEILCPEVGDVSTQTRRGRKKKEEKNESVAGVARKRGRGRPKKNIITDEIKNDDDDDDDDEVFCKPLEKRNVNIRESKSRGKVFIKSVTGKNRTGNQGRKRDLEKGFNDIDKLLENMDNVGTERNVNSENMEETKEKEYKEINYK